MKVFGLSIFVFALTALQSCAVYEGNSNANIEPTCIETFLENSSYCNVSLIALIAFPERYQRTKVDVTGYYYAEDELDIHMLYFGDDFFTGYSRMENMVKLDLSQQSRHFETRQLVRVFGEVVVDSISGVVLKVDQIQ